MSAVDVIQDVLLTGVEEDSNQETIRDLAQRIEQALAAAGYLHEPDVNIEYLAAWLTELAAEAGARRFGEGGQDWRLIFKYPHLVEHAAHYAVRVPGVDQAQVSEAKHHLVQHARRNM